MFLRREKIPVLSKLARAVWPRMGWRRTLRYYWHRLHRIPGTPSFIAIGFAWGAAIAMTPFYGTHMIMAAAIAWVTGGSMLAAIIGCHLANPWTAPALWYCAYYLGELILGGRIVHQAPHFVRMFRNLTESILNLDGAMFMDRVWPVLWPMIVGSLPMALVTWVAAYFIMRSVVSVVHARRADRLRGGDEDEAETG
jgi:uncharacterized protein (DUF2062 family)